MKTSRTASVVALTLVLAFSPPAFAFAASTPQIGDPVTDTVQLWTAFAALVENVAHQIAITLEGQHSLTVANNPSASSGAASQSASAASAIEQPTTTPLTSPPSIFETSASTTTDKPAASQPIIEQVAQYEPLASNGFITQADLTSQLRQLSNSLLGKFDATSSPPLPQNVAADGNPDVPYAAENDISNLSNVTITNANLTTSEIPSLDYLPLSGGTISGNLTVNGAFNGGSLSLSAASTTNLFANSASIGSLTLGSGTTTAGDGVNLSAGCFAVNGVCIGGSGANVGAGTQGQFAFYNAGGTSLAATSSIFVSQSGHIGIGNANPAEPLDLGGNTSSGDDSEILINRTATNPLSNGGSHAVRDESTYQQSSGTGGYASYDAIPTIGGSLSDNHYHAFQARPNITLSSTISDVTGLTFQPTVAASSTVTSSYGLHMFNALGTGTISAQYGVWCDTLTRGASNYCIYDSSTSTPNYFGGQVQLGGALTLPSSFSTYGALLSHDGSGNVIDNPSLTIVNGVLTMSAGTAEVLASATNLQLQSTSGNILMRPAATTVGTWSSTGLSINGSLGIGTSTPGSLLSLNGVANFTSATSTFYSTGGINLTGGCFSINGSCVGSTGGTSNVGSGTQGQFAFYNATGATLSATSSLFIGQSGDIGIGNVSPAEPLDLGGNTSSGDDSEILINRTATNPLSNGGSHAVRDESTYQQSSGSGGYASFDSIPTIAGSLSDNHIASFQSRPNITLSGTLASAYGLSFQPTVNSGSTVTSTYGLYVTDALGTGSIGAQYGVWCDPLTRGTSNYCIYDSSTAPNYFGGLVQLGGSLRFPSSFSTYGALLSHDGSGNVIDNPNLTIVNGVLTMAYSTAEVLASATNLQLQSTSGTILMRPAATTVGTWSSTGLSVSGSVIVGTTTPYSRLEVWGPDTASTSAFVVANNASTTEFAVFDTGNATLAGSLTQNSDERLKTNIQSLNASSSLSLIDQLDPVTFNWIDPNKGTTPQLGFIAQQVLPIFPNLISTTSATALTPDGTLSLNYIDLISPIVSAIQDLSSEVTSIENTIAGFANAFTTNQLTFVRGQGTEIDVQTANVQTLCIGSTCITENQLQALLAAAGQSGTGSGGAASNNPQATNTPPVIAINGDNPAIVQIGATYNDLGATIIGPQADLNLGITTFLNGTLTSNIVIDTSQAATDTIDYVATDQNGLTSTSTRTVVIEVATSTAPST